MVTDEDFEKLRRIVKELIEANKQQLQNQMRLQKQIDLLQEAIQLLRLLNGV